MNTMIKFTQPVATLFEGLFARITQYANRRAAIRELSALPDWQLRDIGVVRGNIPVMVNKMLVAKPLEAKAGTVAARSEIRREESYGAHSGAAA